MDLSILNCLIIINKLILIGICVKYILYELSPKILIFFPKDGNISSREVANKIIDEKIKTVVGIIFSKVLKPPVSLNSCSKVINKIDTIKRPKYIKYFISKFIKIIFYKNKNDPEKK